MDYISVKDKLPEENELVMCGVHEHPLIPKTARFINGKFWDEYNLEIEYFPTHWVAIEYE